MDQLREITSKLRSILDEGLADVLAASDEIIKSFEKKRVSGKLIHPTVQKKTTASPSVASTQRPTTKPALVYGQSGLMHAKKHKTGEQSKFRNPSRESLPLIKAY